MKSSTVPVLSEHELQAKCELSTAARGLSASGLNAIVYGSKHELIHVLSVYSASSAILPSSALMNLVDFSVP